MTDIEEKQAKVLNFLKKEAVGVVATINDEGNPESAAVIISQKSSLEIIFQTPNSSRKYQNLKTNNRVAIAVGFDMADFISLQYEGIAREAQVSERKSLEEIHKTKSPLFEKYGYLPDNKFFIVTPQWIRFREHKAGTEFILNF